MYVQRQQASYQDSLIQFGQEREETFFQVLNIRPYDDNYPQNATSSTSNVIAVYFRFDNRYDIYSLKTYSFLDLLGDLGGLFGSLSAIGLAVVGFFSDRMFVSDIMKKIYQIRKPKQNNHIQHQLKIQSNACTINRPSLPIQHKTRKTLLDYLCIFRK